MSSSKWVFRTLFIAILTISGPSNVIQAATDGAPVSSNVTVTRAGTGTGTVTASSGPINCGGTCTGSYTNGTALVLTATPTAGSQFTGLLGKCTGASTCSFSVAGNATALATFAPLALGTPRLDVDETGTFDALTDGLLTIRYLFGVSGPTLIVGATGPSALRATEPAVAAYLTDIRPRLDIDGNGQADALTDGLLIIRYLFGLRGSTLIAGAIGTGATFSTIVSIESRLQDLLLAKVARGPYLQVGTPISTTVRWRTDVTTTGRVRYGTDPANLSSTANSAAPGKDHEVVVSGLSPDTRYYYSIGDSASVFASGADHRFVTSPPSGAAKPMRIWVIGDAGTGTAAQTTTRDAYYTFNGARETDVLLFLGDNAYNVGSEDEYQRFHFDIYPQVLKNTVSWYTLGNHEAGTGPVGAHPYHSMFSFPSAAQAGGVASGTKAYNSFNYGNVHFINLDSHETSRATNGAMATWLTNDLQNNTMPWIVAFFHHPPHDKGTHNSDVEIQQVEMRTNLMPILEQHGVDLVLAGHSHVYQRSYLIDGHYGTASTFMPIMLKDGSSGRPAPAGAGAYSKPAVGPAPREGTVYVVAGSSGQPGFFQPPLHPAMFVNLNVNGSFVMDVNGNRLDATFISATGSIDDTFTLTKGSVSGNRAPQATISSPSSGLSFAAPPVIPLTAVATDSPGGGVTKVEYYIGPTLIGSSTTTPYSVAWNNPPVGSHRLTARATDTGGLVSISAPVFVTITP